MKNLKPFTRDIALSIVTPEQRIRRQNITSKSSVLKVVSQTLSIYKVQRLVNVISYIC